MTRKQLLSLIVSLVVLIVSMLAGYILLAFVYEGSLLVMGFVGLLVVSISVALVISAIKLVRFFQKEAKDGQK
jgi:Kef-type K+ transport system membrane component KefB